MKKILAFLFAVSLFYFVGAQSVLASSNVNVQSVSYFGPGNTTSANVSVGRGSPVTFDHVGVSSEYSFAFYAVNDIIRDDFPIGQQFIARKDMKLTAVFYPNGSVTPANARHVVVFADASSKIIDIQYVADGGNAVEPNVNIMPPMPTFAKYSETKWLTSTNISDLTGITSNRVYFLQYDLNTTTQFTVTVASGSGDGSYLYNTVVTASPDAPVGENVFSHWEDAEGNVLSYKESYKFTVLSNVSITAVYSASPVSAVPVVNMSDALTLRDNYVSYKGQFDIPAGLTLVEYGFIFSRSSDVLTLDSLGATIVPSNVHNGQTGEFLRSFPNDTFNSVRAYLIVKNASNVQQIVYSDNYFRSVTTLGEPGSYLASFDTETKGSYTSGQVTVNGISWTLDDALIGTDPNKIGAKSVRTRGSIYTNSGFANITTITFKGAKYGTDSDNSVQLLVSKEGTNWIDVSDGLDLTAVTSTTLVDYVFTLSNSVNFSNSSLVAGDVLKIKITVGVLGQRVNIDEITINHGAYSGTIHEIKFNTDSMITTELVADGSTITKENPTKEGYSFAGWFTGDSIPVQYTNVSSISQSLVLNATWSINQYTITFNTAGGTSISPITQDYNTAVVAPSDPTRVGYSFNGWSQAVPSTMPGSNLTITAQWTPVNYSITYNNLEETTHSNPAVYTIETPTITLTNPSERSGFNFAGWYTALEGGSQVTQIILGSTGDIDVYARWTEQSSSNVTVTFDIDIAEATDPTPQVINQGETATEPTNANAKYVWYSDATRTTLFNFSTPINVDTTVYGKIFMKDLIISEYVEGSSNNKYIEIYNGTGASVDLSSYRIAIYPNGGISPNPSSPTVLSGTLLHGQVLVLRNTSAALVLPDGVSSIVNTSITFNGDDAFALQKNITGTWTNIDVFGQIGYDPGTAWSTSGVSTLDKTLVRKPDILSGDNISNDAFSPHLEWNQFAIDTASNLGSHTAYVSNPS